MQTILEFIEVFRTSDNIELFTECACYWFSVILHHRFPNSSIVYNPHEVHFATRIGDNLYDILGLIDDTTDYIDWKEYQSSADDVELISRCCINLERE